jgi:hypothetical protein
MRILNGIDAKYKHIVYGPSGQKEESIEEGEDR